MLLGNREHVKYGNFYTRPHPLVCCHLHVWLRMIMNGALYSCTLQVFTAWWGYIHYVYTVIVDTLGSTGGTCTTIGDTVSLLRTHAYIAPCPYHDVTAQAWFKLPRVLHGVSLKLHKHHTRRANKIHCRHLHTTSLRVGCQATNHFKLVRHKPCFGNLIWNTQSQLVQQVERNYKYGTDPHASSHNIQRCSQV